MKVLYDPQIFVHQEYGGVSRYFFELLKYYNESHILDAYLSLSVSNNHYIQGSTFSSHVKLLPNCNFRGKGSLIFAINKFKAIADLHVKNFDIFHPTYYDPYFLKHLGNKPFVLTVYDMIHEKFKSMFLANNSKTYTKTTELKKTLTHYASHIIAISNSTKQDLIESFNIPESKISVVYLANSLVAPETAAQLPTNIPAQYIIFVGGRSLYKNFKKFIVSSTGLLTKNRDLAIVCVGGGNFSAAELDFFVGLNINDQVLHFDIDDYSLGHFYKNALFFVFPSLYEGFGIPILESFACGCPLLCSNSSSFPEVACDAALYFDPNSEESMRDALERAFTDINLRSELKAKGFLRVKKFSLEITALETKRVYDNVI